jgi:hypothetical protein
MIPFTIAGILSQPMPPRCVIPDDLNAPGLTASEDEWDHTCTITWERGSVTAYNIEVFYFVDGDPVYHANLGREGETIGWGEATYGTWYDISDNRMLEQMTGITLTTFEVSAPVVMIDDAPLFVGIDRQGKYNVIWGNRHRGRPGTLPSYGPVIHDGDPLYCQGYSEGYRVTWGEPQSPAWRGLHCSRFNPPQIVNGELAYTAMPAGQLEFPTQMPVWGDIMGPIHQGAVLIRGENDLGDLDYVHRPMDRMLGDFDEYTLTRAP